MCVTMMVFNVCVNDTVQLLYTVLQYQPYLMEELLVMSFDHVTHLCWDD